MKKQVNGVEVECKPEEEAAILAEWEANSQPATPEELDAIADSVADAMLENDAKMKALGLVMADLVERAFGVSQEVARSEVKTRFRNYYRNLL